MQYRFLVAIVAVSALVAIANFYDEGSDEIVAPQIKAPTANQVLASTLSGSQQYLSAMRRARESQMAENPLVQYKPTAGVQGRKVLDEIYMAGFPIGPDSYRAVENILSKEVSSDEKVAIARILGRLYRSDDPTGYNFEINFNLRGLANDADKEVARTAAITYARTGYTEGVESVLDSAFNRGVFSEDDYYGELAHISPSCSSEVQMKVLEKVINSKNQYAREIISEGIASGSISISEYTAPAKSKVREILRDAEPKFPAETGVFPLTDAVRYATWLSANSLVGSAELGGKPVDIVLERLSDPQIDARKIIGYLLAPESTILLAGARQDSRIENLIAVSFKYARQYPSSHSMQMAVQEIALRANRSVVIR